MQKIKPIAIILTLFILNSCAQLTQIAQSAVNQNLPLTNAEIVGGLKDALLIGADSSITHYLLSTDI
jgi:hypothetical protein